MQCASPAHLESAKMDQAFERLAAENQKESGDCQKEFANDIERQAKKSIQFCDLHSPISPSCLILSRRLPEQLLFFSWVTP